jgi:peptidoglycan/LPS O-acetylase OafA/YrhL
MNYRREVDGLRALAVLPVILFHAGVDWMRGGYIGVDIFFVISGYLITTILLNELEAGTFSVVRFYERRARRILPALFLVIAVCLPFASLWLLPTDMKEFSQSLMAVALFGSNILFWRQSNYFDGDTDLKPLLHTWSLAVEEQFYLVFPLLLMLMWKLKLGRRAMVGLLVAIALGSLAVAQWGVLHHPEASFYLLPSRWWELAAGAIVACHFAQREPKPTRPVLDQSLSLVGFAMVVGSLLGFNRDVPHPSVYTVVPIVGTVLILLHAWPTTLVGRWLGGRVPVAIGLISYSAYLWHHVLFSLARNRALSEPGRPALLGLAVLTLPLAYLSWRFVEQPFRHKCTVDRRMVFQLAAAGTAALIAFGLAGVLTGGYLYRADYRDVTASIEHRLRVNRGLNMQCENYFTLSKDCRTADDPELILWGDSYAMHLAPGLLASNPSLKMVQATKSQCGPIIGGAPVNRKCTQDWAQGCIDSNDKVIEYIKATKSLKYAVLSSPFSQYINDEWLLLTRDGQLLRPQEHALTMFKQTLHTLRELGITPIVFSPPPIGGDNVGRCLGKALLFHEDPALCNVSSHAVSAKQQRVRDFLSEVERDADVVWLNKALCNDETCRSSIEDTFIYRDAGHLSHEGSALLGLRMDFNRLIHAAH